LETHVVTYETRDQTSRQAGERRRAELGKFLKARRATLSPGDFGMPPGSRRRTPGLRREEVALLAGVGVTWYTWLEQGRQINASTQVLDAVARTLRLGRAEREHLYRLAEATPLRTECARTAVPDTIREIVHSLEPLPATLINSRFDILLSNDASEELFWEWHTMPCIHKNTRIREHVAAFEITDLLFPGQRSLYTPRASLTRPWQKARVAAGFPTLRFHDLRHAWCSHLLSEGASSAEVAKMAGHRSSEVTERVYFHFLPRGFDRAREILDRWT
jgi:transcriptional regulator with XRE-family HTH domain